MSKTTQRKTFSEIHEEGASYGWMWYAANKAAANAASEHGLSYCDNKNKRVLSAVALAILDMLNKRDSLVLDKGAR